MINSVVSKAVDVFINMDTEDKPVVITAVLAAIYLVYRCI